MNRALGSGLVVCTAIVGAFLGLRGWQGTAPAEPRDQKAAISASAGDEAAHAQAPPPKAPQVAPEAKAPGAARPSAPKFVAHFPKVPQPAAYEATANENVDFVAVFKGEERNPIWAPAMEDAVGKILSPEKMLELGIEGTEVSSKECRSSACVFEFEYPQKMSESLPFEANGNRIKPVGVINTKTDTLGGVMLTLGVEHQERGGVVYERHKILVAYDQSTINPEALLRGNTK